MATELRKTAESLPYNAWVVVSINTDKPFVYASAEWVSITSGNGLSHVGHQAITLKKLIFFVNLTLGNNRNKSFFIHENAFENVV